MKTAKVASGEPSSSNRRSQPVRQTRTNPPRSNAGLNRLATRDSLSSANTAEQPIDIFPGVTHFADAITALPKELVRHFTLLKEVDAKVFAPQEQLFQFVQDALDSPPPGPARSLNDATSSAAPASAPMSAANSSSGAPPHGNALPEFSANGSTASSVFDDSNLARRHLFRSTAVKIQEMLNSLEEKNHVISTANDALRKQLNRIDDIWPHLSDEFSEEAKWGSDSHWAYPENRAARALNTQAERTRREGAAHLSAAAQFVAEEAAARSESRKQAVAAKKSQKNHTHESEHDDHDNKSKAEASNKKTQSNTKRKTAAAAAANAESPANVGLGITGQTPASNTPAPKRRKVEKPPPNGGTPTGSMATVLQNGKNSKAKASENKRPPSVASNKPNGNVPAPIEIPPPSNGSRVAASENVKTQMEPPSAGPKTEPVRQQSERAPTPKSAVPATGPKEGSAKPAEEVEARKEPTPATAPPTLQQVTTTKSGRASKPSTPAIGSFPDNPPTNSNNNNNNARSRPSRNSEAPVVPKRSHKKGASAAHAAAVQKALVQPTADEDHTVPTDENDVYDPDEPTYCYCERVSFGQMVGCDGEHCTREWFHLGCVGLKVAPGKSGLLNKDISSERNNF
ncbi:hypothetical protein SLS63_012984 [Diaporthe eres]|uniref:Inhibitor of growth protein N-terminal histone-binding domain-containing protein n=1 Tax=Diaporthe eres TaxID=83184 RepID=A0ABR1NPT6_DIAER